MATLMPDGIVSRSPLILLTLGAMLIAQRARLLPTPRSEAIWPILGSKFTFQLIVYSYDLRRDKAPVTPAQLVSYFFKLPNRLQFAARALCNTDALGMRCRPDTLACLQDVLGGAWDPGPAIV